eukprot:TRINITY_DN5893_c1_g1_i2.p1 TRINITY_DN5893_c1_g1~~TRINITY_DN5893_c1_g1_i2.p1  ORF type:complete len:113 (+),score=7.29 TRINITY_DN5893_c1_g1_i2:70-408(+)
MSSKGFLSRLFKFNQVYKGGKEVGVDKFGNRYMFNPDLQPGRQRWIEYASDDVDATQIPAEWHCKCKSCESVWVISRKECWNVPTEPDWICVWMALQSDCVCGIESIGKWVE